MKKYLALTFLILFFVSSFAYAEDSAIGITGAFKLLNFPASIQALAGEESDTYINFLYSGQGIENVSIIGTNLPVGMRLGPVSYGPNGIDSIEWSGTPISTEVGIDYPLILQLTDNSGTMLTQPFDFKVVNMITFTTTSLPDGNIKQPYSGTINFTYNTDKQPNVTVYNLPTGLNLGLTTILSPGNGSVVLSGTPLESGKITLQFLAQVDNTETPTTDIPLLITNNPIAQPQPVTQQTPIVQATSTVVITQPVVTVTQPVKTVSIIKKIEQPVSVSTPDTNQTIQVSTSVSNIQSIAQTVPATIATSPSFFQRVVTFFSKFKFW